MAEQLEGTEPAALGHKLKLARKARGLTQADAARTLGFARATISSIERGLFPITPSLLQCLATILESPANEPARRSPAQKSLGAQFRELADKTLLNEPDIMEAAAELELLAQDYLELERITERPLRPAIAPISIVTGSSVPPEKRGEEAAQAERARLGLGDAPVLDLRSLLEESTAIRIFCIGLSSKINGMHASNEELGPCIAVNRNHSPLRANWSLAHEYGCFLADRHGANITLAEDGPWKNSPHERFANSFARHFLLPREGVQRRLEERISSHGKGPAGAAILNLSHAYRVSPERMFLRLEEFQRIPAGTWEKLKRRGFDPEHAFSAMRLPASPRELVAPLRYHLLAWIAYEKFQAFTDLQLAKKLRIDLESALLEMARLREWADRLAASGLETTTVQLREAPMAG